MPMACIGLQTNGVDTCHHLLRHAAAGMLQLSAGTLARWIGPKGGPPEGGGNRVINYWRVHLTAVLVCSSHWLRSQGLGQTDTCMPTLLPERVSFPQIA